MATTFQQPLASADLKQPLGTADLKQPLADADLSQPLADADLKQPLATADLKQPLPSSASLLSTATTFLPDTKPTQTIAVTRGSFWKGNYQLIDSSTNSPLFYAFIKKMPTLQLYSGSSKDGPMIAWAEFGTYTGKVPLGLGAHEAAGPTVELANTHKWSHGEYALEIPIAGKPRKYLWQRTKDKQLLSTGKSASRMAGTNMVCIEAESKTPVMVFRGQCWSVMKVGNFDILAAAEELGSEGRTLLIVAQLAITEMTARRNLASANASSSGSAGSSVAAAVAAGV